MKWVNLNENWSDLNCLDYAYPKLDGIDPHLIWADVSYFNSAEVFTQRPVPVMFEAKQVDGVKKMPPDYLELKLIPGTEGRFGNFHTGFVEALRLGELCTHVDKLRVGAIALPETKRLGHKADPVPAQKVELLKEVVIGIIDHGIGFANQQFAQPDSGGKWQSRIERIWDQQKGYPAQPVVRPEGVPKENFWVDAKHFGYGRELVNDGSTRKRITTGPLHQIDDWLNAGFSEDGCYRLLRYLPTQRAYAHGTHVLGLAAGNRAYGSGNQPALLTPLVDAASTAKIIAVQLPALPFKDTSGTGLCVQVLDAIAYIKLHAAGRRVVINLSDGAYAGPHDGTSLLERAIDQAFGGKDARDAFVVAAGNQFNQRVHWKSEIPAHGVAAPVSWRILPDDKTDSHLEIWPDSSLTEAQVQQLHVFVTPPGQSQSFAIDFGKVSALYDKADDAQEQALALVVFCRNPPNSYASPQTDPRAMVHIAVAATCPPHKSVRRPAPYGVWLIELKNDGGRSVAFDAYIERDNPALGDNGPSRQSHFVHPDYPRETGMKPSVDTAKCPIKRMGALNNVATAEQVLVVGGVSVNVDFTGKRIRPVIAAYSASGPGRRPGASIGVDLLAASDTSSTVRGLRGSATRSGTSFRMDGTSVAAPQITRAMVNLMAAGMTAADAKADLLTKARSSSVKVDGPPERVGAGVIL